jgi:hypothetical protein
MELVLEIENLKVLEQQHEQNGISKIHKNPTFG